MKKTLTLIVWMFGMLHVMGQPILNQGNMTPGLGSSYRFVKTSYVAPGPDGSNVSHNIATVAGFDSTEVMVGDAHDAPSTDSFPGATHTFLFFPDTIYQFIQISANGFENMGQFYASPPSTYPYDNPKTILPFPMQLGAQYADSFSSVNEEPLFTIYTSGAIEFEGKADGQLTTPFGIYPHVVKVHSVEITRDSIVDSVGAFVSTVTTTSDRYYAPGISLPIVESVVKDVIFFQDSFSVFLVEGTVGTPQPAAFTFSFHPNPAQGMVHIQMEGATGKPVRYDLTDLSGRSLLRGEDRINAAGELSISLGEFKDGLYLLHLESGGRHQTQKVVLDN